MATSERFLDRLNDLLLLDHAAVDAYEQAIRQMESAFVREKLREFQGDHRRHIEALRQLIAQYGGRPREIRVGAAPQRLTLVPSDSDEQALLAMLRTERHTNDTYRDPFEDRSLPDEARSLVLHQRSDESRHLDWINRALAQRLWEAGAPIEPP